MFNRYIWFCQILQCIPRNRASQRVGGGGGGGGAMKKNGTCKYDLLTSLSLPAPWLGVKKIL